MRDHKIVLKYERILSNRYIPSANSVQISTAELISCVIIALFSRRRCNENVRCVQLISRMPYKVPRNRRILLISTIIINGVFVSAVCEQQYKQHQGINMSGGGGPGEHQVMAEQPWKTIFLFIFIIYYL